MKNKYIILRDYLPYIGSFLKKPPVTGLGWRVWTARQAAVCSQLDEASLVPVSTGPRPVSLGILEMTRQTDSMVPSRLTQHWCNMRFYCPDEEASFAECYHAKQVLRSLRNVKVPWCDDDTDCECELCE